MILKITNLPSSQLCSLRLVVYLLLACLFFLSILILLQLLEGFCVFSFSSKDS